VACDKKKNHLVCGLSFRAKCLLGNQKHITFYFDPTISISFVYSINWATKPFNDEDKNVYHT